MPAVPARQHPREPHDPGCSGRGAEQPAPAVCGASSAVRLAHAGARACRSCCRHSLLFQGRVSSKALRWSLALRSSPLPGAPAPPRARSRDSWAELGSAPELRGRSAPTSCPGPAGRSPLQRPKGTICAVGWSQISKAAQETHGCLFLVPSCSVCNPSWPGPEWGEEPQSGCCGVLG